MWYNSSFPKKKTFSHLFHFISEQHVESVALSLTMCDRLFRHIWVHVENIFIFIVFLFLSWAIESTQGNPMLFSVEFYLIHLLHLTGSIICLGRRWSRSKREWEREKEEEKHGQILTCIVGVCRIREKNSRCAHRKLISPFSSFFSSLLRAHWCLNIIFIRYMLIQLRITHDHKKRMKEDDERE